MWSFAVVFITPMGDFPPRVKEIPKPTRVQTFIPQLSGETLYVAVGLRRQLHRNATVRVKLFGSLTRSTRGTAASSSWLRIRTHGVKIGSTSTTNINN
jgi:hypothetical protein